eukprot:SM000048S16557  [mRNA]  locus=s48:438708:439210:+ [translate_table: standard]
MFPPPGLNPGPTPCGPKAAPRPAARGGGGGGAAPHLFSTLAVLQWWLWNVSLVLLNKWIFQMYGFTFPFTLTAIHFLICYGGAHVALRVCRSWPNSPQLVSCLQPVPQEGQQRR